MYSQKDRMLRYGFLFGKRYTDKERLKFLKASQIELEQMKYQTEVTSSDWQFAGSKKHFYNLYVGDVKNADKVFFTYYDTPVKSFALRKRKAFQTDNSALSLFLNLIPSLSIFALALVSLYFGVLPQINEKGWGNIWALIFLVIVFLSLFLITRYRNGIPSRMNLVRNTSSILALLTLAQKLNPSKSVAFAFVDSGTNTGYGLKMAHEFFDRKKQTFIYLDSLGNEGDLQWFSNTELPKVKGKINPLTEKQESLGDILVTSGEEENGYVIIKENRRLDENKIFVAVEELLKFI